MRKLWLMILLGLLPTASAYAQGQCYSTEEMHAEQLLRLHSELMVITVTCRQTSEGANLVPLYTSFTRTNIQTLHDAEETMKRYYKARFGGNGIEQLDKLRTKLGNEFGQKIADVSAPLFCAQCRDLLVEMVAATPVRIEEELERLAETQEPYERMCVAFPDHIAKKGE